METLQFTPVNLSGDTFAVTIVQDGTPVRSIGRVWRLHSGCWAGLAVGANAWTDYLPSRKEAVRHMRLGLTFLTPNVR